MTMSEENNEYCIDSQENHEEEFQGNTNSGYNSQIYYEICNIFEVCKNKAANNNDEGTHDNMHFNPLLGNKLKDFCKFYPIWSAVMTTIFKYGKKTESSASSESLFNDFKNRTFQHKTLPLRIDDFIKIHIKSVEGSVILAESKNQQVRTVIEHSSDSGEIMLNHEVICVACKNGDYPSSAHKCIICNVNVHILNGCSISVGNEEGYGEKRKCNSCYKIQITDVNENSALENWRNEVLEPKIKKKKLPG